VELSGEGLPLEVDGHIGEIGRVRKVAGKEEFAFPLLRGWVIDLKDVERWVGVAVGEGVEAGAKQDVLSSTAADCLSELVLSIAAACNEKRARADGEWTGLVRGIAAGCALNLGRVGTEDGYGDGVGKDEGWLVV
jgi:hypothetical protein